MKLEATNFDYDEGKVEKKRIIVAVMASSKAGVTVASADDDNADANGESVAAAAAQQHAQLTAAGFHDYHLVSDERNKVADDDDKVSKIISTSVVNTFNNSREVYREKSVLFSVSTPCESDHIYANCSGKNNNNNNVNNCAAGERKKGNAPSTTTKEQQQQRKQQHQQEVQHIKLKEQQTQEQHQQKVKHQQKLKDMLLTQHDTIQRQRELLAQKDRDLLKARLERMEQRVTLLKQHKSREPEGNCDSPYSKVDSNFNRLTGRSASPLLSDDFPDDKTQTKTKSLSFCPISEQQSLKKRNLFNNPLTINSDRIPKTISSSALLSSSSSLECLPSQSFSSSQLPPLPPSSAVTRIDSTISSPSTNCLHQQNHKKQIAVLNSTELKNQSPQQQSEQDQMSTDKLYYLCLTETCPPVLPDPQSVKKQSAIEVPCWRYHPVTSCYQLEGTENIDDDIFLKRHMKLEIDEKRRKRWDIQRLREQRHNEKLRRGRLGENNRGGKNSQDVNRIASFCPESKDVQFVEVSEQVPVTAFGSIIPNIKQNYFSLDWFAANENNSKYSNNNNRTKKAKELSKSNSKKGN